jgi:hypothetical protein
VTEWKKIRNARTDLTDYVIHLTRDRLCHDAIAREYNCTARPLEVLLEILDAGVIRPTFALRKNRTSLKPQPTIAGPFPAVCLTEQTIEALIQTLSVSTRYSGYGIAYHKYPLFSFGGRPVIYGSKDILGKRLAATEEGYEDDKDIFKDGLSREDQHLLAHYEPCHRYQDDLPFDFSWEREWRVSCRNEPLPVVLDKYWGSLHRDDYPLGAVVVENDADVPLVYAKLGELFDAGSKWTAYLQRIISLETARRMLAQGNRAYARIDTWPDPPLSAAT